jgi:hypothetical protein
VLPFYNRSEHRTAGEIVAALFARHLSAHTAFRVFDPGVTRQQLLNMRIVMDGGVSLTDADGVASLISADFVVAGRVLDYRDAESGSPTPHVEFSTMLFDHATRRVVFSARSDNSGRDGVRFFDIGTSKTAHGMATQMVGTVVDAIAGEPK